MLSLQPGGGYNFTGDQTLEEKRAWEEKYRGALKT